MANLEKRSQILRQQLDDSIKLYYCQQQQQQQQFAVNRNSNNGRFIVSVNMNNRRILHMLYQDETTACIQISGNMAKTTFNALAKMKISSNNDEEFEKIDSITTAKSTAVSPLQVIVNSGSQQQQQRHVLEATVNCNMTGLNSPVSSIDSGVSSLSSLNSSPASSPGCSPVLVNNIPFHYVVKQQAVSRGRSTSESISTTFGLRSILKKSLPLQITTGRFTRSCSECLSTEDGELEVLVEDVNNESSTVTPRNKRVSFSERLVQERSFRPNSSILSQKKKNQRKQKNKMKKKGASTVEDSSTDDEARHRTNSETLQCCKCTGNESDEVDPIESALAAFVFDDSAFVGHSEKAE